MIKYFHFEEDIIFHYEPYQIISNVNQISGKQRVIGRSATNFVGETSNIIKRRKFHGCYNGNSTKGIFTKENV
jgi:hypothetical protein